MRPVTDKIWRKHHVEQHEVDEIFENRPQYRKIENGDIEGEDLYGAYGQTGAGRLFERFLIIDSLEEAETLIAIDQPLSK